MGFASWISFAVEMITQRGRKRQPETWTDKLIIVGEQLFPADDREKLYNWVCAAKPWIITAVVILLICRCCCCGGRGRTTRSGKTMKAPGRDYRMLRAEFEENPRAYFRGVRGKIL
ncbi:hypothetical protein NMG60_11036199 [Bertholletia excelsa]